MTWRRLKSPLGQTGIYASGLIISKALSFLMLPVFTHYLSPGDYGRLEILQTLANLLSIIVGLGLADTLFRFAGSETSMVAQRKHAANLLGLALAISLASLIILQSIASMLLDILPGSLSEIQLRLILLSLSLTSLILVPMGWFRLNNKAGFYFAGSAGRGFAQAGLIFILLSSGWGLDGILFAGSICASTLAITLFAFQIRDTGIGFSLPKWKNYGHFGHTLVVAGIATFLLDSCDRFFLASAAETTVLAEYALAGKVGIMAALLMQPFELWWLPRRFKGLESHAGKSNCSHSTEIGLCLTILAAISVSGSGALIIQWMTPESYHDAIQYVPALAILAALNAATTLMMTGVLCDQKTRKPIWIDGSAAVIVVIGYTLLIPTMLAWGAIIATAVALLYRFSLYTHLGAKVLDLPIRWARLIFPLATGVGSCFACTLPSNSWMVFATGATGGVATLGLVLLLGLCPFPATMKDRLNYHKTNLMQRFAFSPKP